jgi:hypothetical protein
MPEKIQEGGAGKGHWAERQTRIKSGEEKGSKGGDFALSKSSDMLKLLKS